MKIRKYKESLKICFSPKEIANLLVSNFFRELFSVDKLKNEFWDSKAVSDHIKILSERSVNSTEYELYTSILDLYELFNKDCEFCFNLKSGTNTHKINITSIEDLYSYREDPPDVIVYHKGKLYDFELKRYRDPFTYETLYFFIKSKIINHYSGKSNFLIILQLKAYTNIDINIFRKISENLKTEKNQPGIISFSLNNDNKEMILIRVLPELIISKRPYSEVNAFAEILHSE